MTIYLYLFQSQLLTKLLELALNFLWSNFFTDGYIIYIFILIYPHRVLCI